MTLQRATVELLKSTPADQYARTADTDFGPGKKLALYQRVAARKPAAETGPAAQPAAATGLCLVILELQAGPGDTKKPRDRFLVGTFPTALAEPPAMAEMNLLFGVDGYVDAAAQQLTGLATDDMDLVSPGFPPCGFDLVKFGAGRFLRPDLGHSVARQAMAARDAAPGPVDFAHIDYAGVHEIEAKLGPAAAALFPFWVDELLGRRPSVPDLVFMLERCVRDPAAHAELARYRHVLFDAYQFAENLAVAAAATSQT